MHCASHIRNLVKTTDADKTLNKYAIYKKYYRLAFAKAQERCGINSPEAARRRMS